MSLANFIVFPDLGDSRGSLVVMDDLAGLPFKIRRAYYLFGSGIKESRGFHAHKTLHQVAVCISGACKMVLDDGEVRDEFRLNSPFRAIELPPLVWHEMHEFSEDCVLLVLADNYYDEADYLRNYEDFLERVSV